MPDLSPATISNYERDWRDFIRWAGGRGFRHSEDQTAAVVADYIRELVGRKRSDRPSAATLRRIKAALDYSMSERGIEPASRSEDVQKVWNWALRVLSGRGNRSGRVDVEEAAGHEVVAMVASQPDTTVGIRDRALLLIGAGAGLTGAETLRLTHADVDAEGGELSVGLPEGGSALLVGEAGGTSPASAYAAWSARAGRQGPLFPSVDRHGNVSSKAMGSGGLVVVVRRAASLAGLPDPERWGPSDVFVDRAVGEG